jgi:hypothetical protein
MKKALGLWVVRGLVDTFTGRKFFMGLSFSRSLRLKNVRQRNVLQWTCKTILWLYFRAGQKQK